MTSRGGSALTWFTYDLPKKINNGTASTEFTYGVDRARITQTRKTGSTTNSTITYIGELVEREVAGGTTTWRHYVSARGRVVAQVNRVGTTNTAQYLHRDQQGSVVEVTGSTGALVQSLAFDAWGLRRNPANWAPLASPFAGTQPTKRGYTGHEHLDNVELVHMNGRVQDPKLGRFISADPTVPEPFNTQSFDRYSYVFNNPGSLVDPSGFSAEDYGNPGWPIWDPLPWGPPRITICCFVFDPETGGIMGPKGDASWNPGGFSMQNTFMEGEHDILGRYGGYRGQEANTAVGAGIGIFAVGAIVYVMIIAATTASEEIADVLSEGWERIQSIPPTIIPMLCARGNLIVCSKMNTEELPKELVGTQDEDARAQGNRHNSGPLDTNHGGTGDAQEDFDKLTGAHEPAPAGSSYPPGTRIGDNKIIFRPGDARSGPRIDIPANGPKPHETLHYPK